MSRFLSKFPAFAACTWSWLFAAVSTYWALGGTVGIETISPNIAEMADTFWFVAVLWITVFLKVLGGVIALSLVRPWGASLPRMIRLVASWGAGIVLTLYAGANLVVRGMMMAGVLETPQSMHSTAARWHLLLWDPWWLLGGILFIAAAWNFSSKR